MAGHALWLATWFTCWVQSSGWHSELLISASFYQTVCGPVENACQCGQLLVNHDMTSNDLWGSESTLGPIQLYVHKIFADKHRMAEFNAHTKTWLVQSWSALIRSNSCWESGWAAVSWTKQVKLIIYECCFFSLSQFHSLSHSSAFIRFLEYGPPSYWGQPDETLQSERTSKDQTTKGACSLGVIFPFTHVSQGPDSPVKPYCQPIASWMESAWERENGGDESAFPAKQDGWRQIGSEKC